MKYLKIKNNLIHSTAIIDWKNLIIGKNNKIGPYTIIGATAQHPKKKSSGKIIIGNNNSINQFVSIHRPTRIKKETHTITAIIKTSNQTKRIKKKIPAGICGKTPGGNPGQSLGKLVVGPWRGPPEGIRGKALN